MKALGIVRRIDTLGRVMVPKEYRTMLGWTPGTPIEILPNEDGSMIFREYGISREKSDLIMEMTALIESTDNLEARMIYSKAIELIRDNGSEKNE